MPAFNLTAKRARRLWEDHGPAYQGQIMSWVGLLPTAEIVDWIVGQMIQIAIKEAPRAWAWFARQAAALRARLEAAADRLDDRLKWHNIANEDLRDLFEANDDLYDHFKSGLLALISDIEKDVAQAELSAGLGLLEGDALAGFFSQPRLRAPLKPEPIDDAPDRETTPVDSQREAVLLRDKLRAEDALAEAEAAREAAETRAAAAEARAAELSALMSAVTIEGTEPAPEPEPADDAEPEPADEPEEWDLSADTMPFPDATEPPEPAHLSPEQPPSVGNRALAAVKANGPMAERSRRERQQRRGTGNGRLSKIANAPKRRGQ